MMNFTKELLGNPILLWATGGVIGAIVFFLIFFYVTFKWVKYLLANRSRKRNIDTELSERITKFNTLDYEIRLDSWEELLSIGIAFVKYNCKNKELAEKIAKTIYDHRSLMGSSRVYESASEIDIPLLDASLPIARIGMKNSNNLIPFLASALYYSDFYPKKYNKKLLEKEMNEIKKEQFLENGNWSNENTVQNKVYSNFLGHEIIVQISFSQYDNNKKLSNFAINSVNDFLNLEISNRDWIKDNLWKACDDCFQNTSYGLNGAPRKEGQTEYEANKDLFEIYNSKDAFIKSKAKYVVVNNDDEGLLKTCFYLEYETPWDLEHGLVFVFVDGQKHAIE